jgi:hypothetical protein
MVNQGLPKPTSDQGRKFEELARQLECDESEEAFKAKVVRVARAKERPKPDQSKA